MRLRKNIARASTFALVGALGVAGFIAVNNNTLEDSTAVTGSWATFVSTAWMNESDARYKDYTDTPGSTESSPYLIQTADEFSGIRAFENGSALAGKYLMLTGDIDLSAHYWDPIELYGSGSPEDDIWDEIYDDGQLDLAAASEMVHFDGNSMKISGMNIENTYDKVIAGGDYSTYYTGATGLFSYTYKASISNIRLDSPIINLTETSGVPIYDSSYYYGENPVSDLMGSVVGVAQNSQIAGVHVNNLKLDYTASFGDYVTDRCDERSFSADGCNAYFSPVQIVAGGAIGLSFGETLVSETSVKDGVVNVVPQVDETAGPGWGMYALYDGIVSVAGLVGVNMQSAVLSTCSSADVVFSDNNYTLAIYEDVEPSGYGSETETETESIYSLPSEDFEQYSAITRPRNGYKMFFGGLIGFSTSESYSVSGGAEVKCIYNSCSHSKLSIDAELSYTTAIGGIVGFALEERIMNNYHDGVLAESSSNIFGEIVGGLAQYDYDDSALKSNFYMNRGYDPIGMTMDGIPYTGFAQITTVEALAASLNNGRAYVMGDLASHTNMTSAQISQMTTEWAVQDGTFPLACTNSRSAGLVFPDNRIDVPATGAK